MKNFSYKLSDIFIKILTFNYDVVRKIIRNEIPRDKNLSVIDLGCGTGTLAELFNKNKYLGVDVDKGAIWQARRKFPGYKFKIGDAVNFKTEVKFDLVLVVGVLHHLPDEKVKKVARRINSLLNKNGKVLIIEATYPLAAYNIFGLLLRKLDRGSFVRSVGEYAKLLTIGLFLNKQYKQKGGLLDYAVFNASGKAR
jgi:SAM-dependent methyltransferase